MTKPDHSPSAAAKLLAYEHAREVAVELGFPSLTEALEELDHLLSRRCKTCGGSRRIHVVAGTTTPAHDRDCPACVGWPVSGDAAFRLSEIIK